MTPKPVQSQPVQPASVSSSNGGIPLDKYEASLKRQAELESQLEKIKLAQLSATDRDKAMAQAEIEKAKTESEKLSEQLRTAQSQAKKNATLAHLSDLKDPLYLTLAPDVHLNDLGLLTDDSKAALDKFRSTRKELFTAPIQSSTPMAGSSGKLAPNQWTEEQHKMFRAARIQPGEKKQSPLGKEFSWMFGFDNGNRPWKDSK
jgi:multidrug efflux pump subunit AcrA (membrane-fusion protein)